MPGNLFQLFLTQFYHLCKLALKTHLKGNNQFTKSHYSQFSAKNHYRNCQPKNQNPSTPNPAALSLSLFTLLTYPLKSPSLIFIKLYSIKGLLFINSQTKSFILF